MQKQKTSSLLYIVAATLLLIGAILALLEIRYGMYLFVAGSVGVIFTQAQIAYENRNEQMRQKRLSRLSALTSVLLLLASYSMYTGTNSWVVLLLMYALSSLFLSFRGDKKEDKLD